MSERRANIAQPPGVTLAERLASGWSAEAEPAELVRIVRALADALALLHTREPPVAHGALAPDAVVLRAGTRGSPVASVLLLDPSGDPPAAYRAPEHAAAVTGEVWGVGPEADQFALASIAFECLTGTRAFPGDDAAAREAIAGRARPWVATFSSEVPDGVDEVLHRAWSVEPGARFASVRAFAEALARVLAPAAGADDEVEITNKLPASRETGVVPRNRAAAAAPRTAVSTEAAAPALPAPRLPPALPERPPPVERAEPPAPDSASAPVVVASPAVAPAPVIELSSEPEADEPATTVRPAPDGAVLAALASTASQDAEAPAPVAAASAAPEVTDAPAPSDAASAATPEISSPPAVATTPPATPAPAAPATQTPTLPVLPAPATPITSAPVPASTMAPRRASRRGLVVALGIAALATVGALAIASRLPTSESTSRTPPAAAEPPAPSPPRAAPPASSPQPEPLAPSSPPVTADAAVAPTAPPEPAAPVAAAASDPIAAPAPSRAPRQPTWRMIEDVRVALTREVLQCTAGHPRGGRHVFIGVMFEGPTGVARSARVTGALLPPEVLQCIERGAVAVRAAPVREHDWGQSYRILVP